MTDDDDYGEIAGMNGWQGKQGKLGGNPLQSLSFYHKFNMTWPALEPESLSWESGDKPPERLSGLPISRYFWDWKYSAGGFLRSDSELTRAV
jgi:hypothetical protein